MTTRCRSGRSSNDATSRRCVTPTISPPPTSQMRRRGRPGASHRPRSCSTRTSRHDRPVPVTSAPGAEVSGRRSWRRGHQTTHPPRRGDPAHAQPVRAVREWSLKRCRVLSRPPRAPPTRGRRWPAARRPTDGSDRRRRSRRSRTRNRATAPSSSMQFGNESHASASTRLNSRTRSPTSARRCSSAAAVDCGSASSDRHAGLEPHACTAPESSWPIRQSCSRSGIDITRMTLSGNCSLSGTSSCSALAANASTLVISEIAGAQASLLPMSIVMRSGASDTMSGTLSTRSMMRAPSPAIAATSGVRPLATPIRVASDATAASSPVAQAASPQRPCCPHAFTPSEMESPSTSMRSTSSIAAGAGPSETGTAGGVGVLAQAPSIAASASAALVAPMVLRVPVLRIRVWSRHPTHHWISSVVVAAFGPGFFICATNARIWRASRR